VRVSCGSQRARLGSLNIVIDGDLRHRRTEEPSTRGRFPYGADQILLGALFEHVADGAVLECLKVLALRLPDGSWPVCRPGESSDNQRDVFCIVFCIVIWVGE